MIDDIELILTSSVAQSASTINLWSVKGTFLGSYQGGGHCPPHSLTLCGGSIIAGEKSKPLLHSWPLNKHQKDINRLLCSGKITCIDCSPDFCHLAVGVQHNLHLIQISSGRLLSIGSSHFQPLSVVKFNSDGTLVGCGGEDGLVTVWNIGAMALKKKCTAPSYTFSEHSLPVGDIVFTNGGLRSRIISVSGDRTCKIHDLVTSRLLLTLVFDSHLTSLALSDIERYLFIGNGDGVIYKTNLCSAPRSEVVHFKSGNGSMCLVGHTKAITSLSCSMNSMILISGSMDENVKVWHVSSGQCLRTIHHKGPVTNILIFIPPIQFLSPSFQPLFKIHNFSLSTDTEEELSVDINIETDLEMPESPETHFGEEISDNQKIDRLQSINNELYEFSLNRILGKKLKFNVTGIDSDVGVTEKMKKKKPIVKKKKIK